MFGFIFICFMNWPSLQSISHHHRHNRLLDSPFYDKHRGTVFARKNIEGGWTPHSIHPRSTSLFQPIFFCLHYEAQIIRFHRVWWWEKKGFCHEPFTLFVNGLCWLWTARTICLHNLHSNCKFICLIVDPQGLRLKISNFLINFFSVFWTI